jgi:hypothetical protein
VGAAVVAARTRQRDGRQRHKVFAGVDEVELAHGVAVLGVVPVEREQKDYKKNSWREN